VCIIDGITAYGRFPLHTGTPLAQAEDHNDPFLPADFDGDGIPDLYFIKRRYEIKEIQPIRSDCRDSPSIDQVL